MIKKRLLLFGLILNIFLLYPLLSSAFFPHHLDHQVLRLQQMNECIKDLQFPCRWTADLGGLYGLPLFNYLPPFPYYFGELFYLLTGNLLLAYKMIFIVSFVASFIFMYLLGRRLWGELGGVLSGVFYILAPYHAVSLYVRGDIGELFALAAFPAIFWSILRLWESTKVTNILSLGLSIAVLLLSDLMLALVTAPLILLLVIALNVRKGGVRLLKFNLLALLMGLSLSAFYILPAIMEISFIHDPTVSWPYLAYTEHFKGFSRMLVDRTWGYNESVRQTPQNNQDTMSYQIGWAHLLVVGLVILCLPRLYKKDQPHGLIVTAAILLGSLSFIMIHPMSIPIWQTIDFLKYFQYPWRFLSTVIFFYSLLAGSVLLLAKDKRYKKYLFAFLIVLVLFLNLAYFKPEKRLQITSQNLMLGSLYQSLIRKTSFEYLPITTSAPPENLSTQGYQIIGGHPEISQFSVGSNWIKFNLKTADLTTIRLSQRYFPNWRVFVSGVEKEINPNNTYGLIVFAVDPGEYNVEARLFDTPIRVAGNLITLGGLVLFLFLVLSQFQKSRRFLLHYIRAFN